MVSLTEILRLLPEKQKNAARLWGAYSMVWLPLTASTVNVKSTVTTQDDSSFVITRMKAYATTNAAPPVENPAPQATVSFQIGSNQIFPDGNPVHVSNFGVNSTSEHQGADLDYPMLVPPQTTLQGFGNNLTATDIMLRITFYGIRIFAFDRATSQL